MKMKAILQIACMVSFSFADNQFTNMYDTKVACTTVKNVEYCYLSKVEDIFVVFNYQDVPDKILFHGKNSYLEYIPIGKPNQKENSRGVFVWANDYMDPSTGKEKYVMYSRDNLWFHSDWNGHEYCYVTKYWNGNKDSFRKSYKFKEVFSSKEMEELGNRCHDEK